MQKGQFKSTSSAAGGAGGGGRRSSVASSGGGSRIHLKNTQALSRRQNEEPFSTTDSLKLYEAEIIRAHAHSNSPIHKLTANGGSVQARPLSLCLDLGSSGEEVNVTDESLTSSNSTSWSTASSSSSSHSTKPPYYTTGLGSLSSATAAFIMSRQKGGLTEESDDASAEEGNACPIASQNTPCYIQQEASPTNRHLSISTTYSSAENSLITVIPKSASLSAGFCSSPDDDSEDIYITCPTTPNAMTSTTTSSSLAFSNYSPSSSSSDSINGGDANDTYDFSTFDSDHEFWYKFKVEPRASHSPKIGPNDFINQLPYYKLSHLVKAFNQNNHGSKLLLAKEKNQITGSIRIFVNLLKPVRLSLHSKSTSLFEKSFLNQSKPMSSFIPRGSSKCISINRHSTAKDAIELILHKLHIQESHRKFNLYEHVLKEKSRVEFAKLDLNESILSKLIHSTSTQHGLGSDKDHNSELRLVLQDNESVEIKWSQFSLAELSNFLLMLDKEELEAKDTLENQYKHLILRLETRRDILKPAMTS